MKPLVRLTDWKLVWYYSKPCLRGTVWGHPHILDGYDVTTTQVQEINFDTKRAITLNTVYQLEGPETCEPTGKEQND